MRATPLLFDLAQLLDAGLAPAQAVGRLEAGTKRERRALTLLTDELRRGSALARALAIAGFADSLDARIVAVGEQSGKLDQALRYLADRYDKRRSRIASLRARLWLPNAVLGIVLIIGMVRATTAGASWASAMFDAGVTASVVIGFTYLIVATLARDASAWLALAWRYNLLKSGTLARRYFEHMFFTLLHWQTEAGVDYAAGTSALVSLIDNRRYRESAGRYRAALQQGRGVTEALQHARLVESGELLEVIRIGEQSGRFSEALGRYLDDEGARLDRITDALFAWLPRGYYVFVLLLGGSSML